MPRKAIEIARSPLGKIKMQEKIDGELSSITLLEPVGRGAVLKSTFNRYSELTAQELIEKPTNGAEGLLNALLSSNSQSHISEIPYVDIKVDKKCPKCGHSPLSRYMDKVRLPSDVPVMPMLVCDSCATKCYNLNDEYLKKLVESHPELFEPDEIAYKEADEKAFMEELRANIIRIFASKRIMNVE